VSGNLPFWSFGWAFESRWDWLFFIFFLNELQSMALWGWVNWFCDFSYVLYLLYGSFVLVVRLQKQLFWLSYYAPGLARGHPSLCVIPISINIGCISITKVVIFICVSSLSCFVLFGETKHRPEEVLFRNLWIWNGGQNLSAEKLSCSTYGFYEWTRYPDSAFMASVS